MIPLATLTDAHRTPIPGAFVPSDTINAAALVANTAVNITVPAGADFVLLYGTVDFYVQFNGAKATLSTALVGDNNDITYTAKWGGTAGNSITVAYVDPSENDAVLSVEVTGTDIVVNLATGAAGAITTTAAQIVAAVNANATASALVGAANKGTDTGAGVVTALAQASLTGGAGATVAADNAAGTAAELVKAGNPTIRRCYGGHPFSVISAATCLVTAAFYS